jgi:hypothetical protein
VQSSRAKSHLGQHISLRSPLERSARSWTTSSQVDSFFSRNRRRHMLWQWHFLCQYCIVILGIVIG